MHRGCGSGNMEWLYFYFYQATKLGPVILCWILQLWIFPNYRVSINPDRWHKLGIPMANGRITPHPDTSLKQRAFSGPALEDSTRSWMLLTHPYATSPLPREIKMQAPKCQGTRSRPPPATAPPRPRPPGLGTLFGSARCPFLPVNLSSPVLTRFP